MNELLKIFPVSVYASTLKFGDDELNFVKSLQYEFVHSGTYHEKGIKDRFVLDESIFSSFREEIQTKLDFYATQILKYKNKFRITNSWINLNSKGTYHSKHIHSNSIISGVYYIHVPEDAPGITLYNPRSTNIFIDCEEWNDINSISWQIKVKSNTLILFPSDIYHEVEISNSNEDRLSLAFNSFPYGEIGWNSNRLVIQ